MSKKSLLILMLLGAALSVQAQSTPAKKELVARILKLQQPGIETMARSLAEMPAAELLERASNVLPMRVAADKRDSVTKDLQADARKFVDEAVPLVRDRAVKHQTCRCD